MDFSGDNQDWHWISDNTTLTFQNWENLEPDTFSDVCVFARSDSTFGGTGEWLDASCDSVGPAICEADLVSEHMLFKYFSHQA